MDQGARAPFEIDMDNPADLSGNSFGYSLLQQAVYAGVGRKARIRAGAPIRLQVVSPGLVRPSPGQFNAVFTMWENHEMEDDRIQNLKLADKIYVPSRFCVDVFKEFGFNATRIPLGIHPELWPFKARHWDGSTTFRWLWNGAPNARKGWDVLEDAWQPFRNLKNCELYIKTSGDNRANAGIEEIVRRGNVIVDNRRIPQEELLALYHSAHGFVFPTAGEGWGLTLHEAMATGLPAIVTKYSGHLDFCDASTVTFVGYEDGRARMAREGLSAENSPPFIAVREHVAGALLAVMNEYPKAVTRARIAAQRVRRFTWQRTTDTLVWSLSKVYSSMKT